MTRAEATEKILAAKKKKRLTFESIAAAVGRHKVWTAAALLGQATMSQDEASKVGALLGVDADVVAALQEIPTKGSLHQTAPVDPLIRANAFQLPQFSSFSR